jgi:HK97 family phage major capsid protein
MPEQVRLRVEEPADRMFGNCDGDRPPDLYAGQGDVTPGVGNRDEATTFGEAYVRSDAHKMWIGRFPQGGPPERITVQGDSVLIRAGVRDLERMRALVTATDASAGRLIPPHFAGLLEPGRVRPLTVRQLLTVIPTASDAVSYAREVSRVSAAAPVEEAEALTGTTGTKPEGGLVFEIVEDRVRTIAESVPATRRIVADAPQLRAYIDTYLTEDLGIELEDQVVAGDGNGENQTGILNTAGVDTVGPPGAGQSPLDVIRIAKRTVRTGGRTNATTVLLNPEDSERIDLLKGNDEVNRFVAGPPWAMTPGTLWGLPIVESEALPVGTALVGDFRRAVLFDR